ncbi:MAG: hypothetical protein K9I85_07310 [Saprospiraceae bacterium]|nr:hypothetical protein [Saprospiraceae bacterium]
MDMTFRLPIVRHLVFRDLYINKKSALIFAGVLLGLLCLFGVTSKMNPGPPDPDFHMTWYGIFLFLFGILQTGGVYAEFAQPATRQDYLLLPASNLEKWASRWFRTLPFYLIAYTLIYWIASWIMNLICLVAFGEIYLSFQPYHSEVFSLWKIYTVAHAIFIIGAVHFNKSATIKTALTILIIMTIISFIGGVTAWMLFQGVATDGVMVNSPFSFNLSEHSNYWIGQTGKVIFWLVLIPLFWWISFLKLNEKEV